MSTELERLPGLDALWKETQGDPAVVIAVIDGPVDLTHPCFQGAALTTVPTLVVDAAGPGRMSAHGTHVASLIFGRRAGGVVGVAPGCRGLIAPIYSDGRGPTSQWELARAIDQAVEQGAQLINVSGGELTNRGEAEPCLAEAVRRCRDRGVLVVAAAGNDRCRCLHVPAALPGVLVVGAADGDGRPLDSSNWGDAYQSQGVLAPGLDVPGAAPGGGLALKSGTSFATPIVTGVVALLLSLRRRRGGPLDPYAVRDAILATAVPCEPGRGDDCLRFLVGRLNIPGAHALLSQSPLRVSTMHDEQSSEEWNRAPDAEASAPRPASESVVSGRSDGAVAIAGLPTGDADGAVAAADLEPASTAEPAGVRAAAAREPGWVGGDRLGLRREVPAVAGGVLSAGVTASDGCSCQGRSGRSPVFAIGVLGYDFGTEARRDTFKSLMPSVYPAGYPYFGEPDVVPYPPNPYDPRQMVNYLAGYPRPRPPFPSSGGFPRLEPPAFPPEDPPVPDDYLGLEASPWDAAELTWTLNIELTPIYAIRPAGSFSPEAYRKLMEFLDGQTRNPHDVEFIERVSIPGYLSGESVRLFSGEVVPVLVPNVRGMFGWNTPRLIEAVVGTVKEKVRSEARAAGRNLEPDSDQLSRAEPEARRSLRSFLDRIYYDLRNLGRTPAERALNYSATNAFQAAFVFADPASKGMQLDTILVDRSPFCRKDSECMDVKLRFFDPENLQRARLVSRFTVDVSDVYPVLVGPIRTWSEVG